MKTATTSKPDLFQEVTDSIIAQLEQGAAPWVKPWQGDGGHPGASNVPRNHLTGTLPAGINPANLARLMREAGDAYIAARNERH